MPIMYGRKGLKFMTEVSSIMAKICNINFWIENDPPLLWNFSENSSVLEGVGVPYDDDDGDYILAVRQLESTIFNTSLGLCAAVAGVIMMVLILVEIISFGILTVNRWHQFTTNTEKRSFLPKLGKQKHPFNSMTYPWW